MTPSSESLITLRPDKPRVDWERKLNVYVLSYIRGVYPTKRPTTRHVYGDQVETDIAFTNGVNIVKTKR
ncbi:hypothetical protein IAD21_05389 [Abditibacteriota bacterium]|nr:hypothetical protein IAD21_05389 [Abditibacteriota bacterium]